MGWETRRGSGRYYTRSVRHGGRVLRQYVGTGPQAEAAARADRVRRAATEAGRTATRSALEKISEADAQVKAVFDATEIATRAALLLAGYHRHDRGPGCVDVSENPSSEIMRVAAEMEITVKQADRGDQNALLATRRLFDMLPNLWDVYGNLAAAAERTLVDLYSGQSALTREGLCKKLAAMRSLLAGPAASPLEQMLVERVVACYLQSYHADFAYAKALKELSSKEVKFYQRRQDRAARTRSVPPTSACTSGSSNTHNIGAACRASCWGSAGHASRRCTRTADPPNLQSPVLLPDLAALPICGCSSSSASVLDHDSRTNYDGKIS